MPDREQSIIHPEDGKYNQDMVQQTVNALVPELTAEITTRVDEVLRRSPLSLVELTAGRLPGTILVEPLRAEQAQYTIDHVNVVDRQSIAAVLLIDQLALVTDREQLVSVMANPFLYAGFNLFARRFTDPVRREALRIRHLLPEITDVEIDECTPIERELIDAFNSDPDAEYYPRGFATRQITGNAGFFAAAAKRLQVLGGPKLTPEKHQILQNLGVEIK